MGCYPQRYAQVRPPVSRNRTLVVRRFGCREQHHGHGLSAAGWDDRAAARGDLDATLQLGSQVQEGEAVLGAQRPHEAGEGQPVAQDGLELRRLRLPVEAEAQHLAAVAGFAELNGHTVLSMTTDGARS